MSLSNNDWNHRLVAAEDIPENCAVKYNSSGKVVKATDADTEINGIVPQPIKANQRCPVMRGGTVSDLSGFTAGARLKVQASGLLGTAGSGVAVAMVKSEDATTAVILSGNIV